MSRARQTKRAEGLAELCDVHRIRKVSLAFGVFDGVHRGHRKIIDRLLYVAAEQGSEPVVMTFSPHPRVVLQPDRAPRLLTPAEHKFRVLAASGVAAVVFQPFTREFADLSPADFVRTCLRSNGLRVSGVCVGRNWRFGHKAKGDTNLLKELGARHGFRVEAVPEFQYYGKPISSTRIRMALAGGRLHHVARMLGRAYSVFGTVVHGRGAGRATFNCPTANVATGRVQLPPAGVYAGKAIVPDRSPPDESNAIIYVGRCPSMTERGEGHDGAIVEVHLLDGEHELYGRQMEVRFLEFVREEAVFPSVSALRRQIGKDLELVGAMFAELVNAPSECS